MKYTSNKYTVNLEYDSDVQARHGVVAIMEAEVEVEFDGSGPSTPVYSFQIKRIRNLDTNEIVTDNAEAYREAMKFLNKAEDKLLEPAYEAYDYGV